MAEFRYPRIDEHLSIIGQNGSGKTQAAAWALAHYPYDKMPCVIVDYKREPLFAQVEGIQLLGVFRGRPPWKRPRRPGLYLVQPEPWEDEEFENFLYQIWKKGKTILYFDEAHMVPKQEKGAFQAILTQGRSKRIPCIVLTQKPSWASRFVFSEAKHFNVFYLNDHRDYKVIENFIPYDLQEPLPPYHSRWYDTGQRHLFTLSPVPDQATIIRALEARLPRRW